MLLPTTLHMEMMRAFFFKPSRRPASVSAVSPDWLMGIIRVLLLISGSRYLNSDPRSTSTGILHRSSIMNLPTVAACQEVPQPTITTFSMPLISAGVKLHPSRKTLPFSSSILPLKVSIIARGCSKISLSIKCLNPLFSAMAGLQSMVAVARLTAAPGSVDISTPFLLRTAISPSSRKITFLV